MQTHQPRTVSSDNSTLPASTSAGTNCNHTECVRNNNDITLAWLYVALVCTGQWLLCEFRESVLWCFCLLSNEWPMAYVWHQLRMTSWSPLTDIVMNAVETYCCSLVYPKPLVFMYFVIEMQFHADGSFIWRGYPALERSRHVFRSFDLFYNLDYSSIF